MTESKDPQRDERLSAYLDGELSSTDREQFDREMEHDAPLRELHDQLRLISDTLKELPLETAPDGLADRIAADVSRAPVTPSAGSTTSHHASGSSRRRFLWAACAAAAVLGVVMYQWPSPQSEVAQVDNGEVTEASRDDAADFNERKRGVAGDEGITVKPPPSLDPQASEIRQARQPLTEESADFVEADTDIAQVLPQSAPVDDAVGLEQTRSQPLGDVSAQSIPSSPAVKEARTFGLGESEAAESIYIVRVTPNQAKTLRTQLEERGFEIEPRDEPIEDRITAYFGYPVPVRGNESLQVNTVPDDVMTVLNDLGVVSVERLQPRSLGRRAQLKTDADDRGTSTAKSARPAAAVAEEDAPVAATDDGARDASANSDGSREVLSDQKNPTAPVLLILRIETETAPKPQP